MDSTQTSQISNLVPLGYDEEGQRQFEANERRKKQNRIAQRNCRVFVCVIAIQSLCILTILREEKGQSARAASWFGLYKCPTKAAWTSQHIRRNSKRPSRWRDAKVIHNVCFVFEIGVAELDVFT